MVRRGAYTASSKTLWNYVMWGPSSVREDIP